MGPHVAPRGQHTNPSGRSGPSAIRRLSSRPEVLSQYHLTQLCYLKLEDVRASGASSQTNGSVSDL